MTYKQLLFSFKGRINRATYWKFNIILIVSLFAIIVLGNLICSGIIQIFSIPKTSSLIMLIFIPPVIASLFPILGLYAVGAKRCHDINMSGWLQLVYWIPLIGEIFWVVLGVIPGTEGENKYGSPPPTKTKDKTETL